MNVELSPEEVHALIEWHDGEAEIANTWDRDHVEEAREHKKRADELFFMLTGAKRKQADARSESTNKAVQAGAKDCQVVNASDVTPRT